MKKFSSIWEELGYVAGQDDQKKQDQKEMKKIVEQLGKKDELLGKKDEILEKKKKIIEQTTLNLLGRGLSISEISEITGLSPDEIIAIQKRR